MSNLSYVKWKKKQHGNHSKMSLPIFLNYKAENYLDMMADLVQSYKTMGSNMSIKDAFLRLSFRLPPRKSQGNE